LRRRSEPASKPSRRRLAPELVHVLRLPWPPARRADRPSSGATRRVAPSPSCWSTARRIGHSERCSSGCWGSVIGRP